MGACSKQLLQKVCPQFSTSFHGKVKSPQGAQRSMPVAHGWAAHSLANLGTAITNAAVHFAALAMFD